MELQLNPWRLSLNVLNGLIWQHLDPIHLPSAWQ